MNDKDVLTDKDWIEIKSSRSVRRSITEASFYWFFHIYFAHYIKFPTAEFQKEMMRLASDPEIEQLVVCAFRESGKSTIITTALPLWSIVGNLQKKFIVICSQTQAQARQHLANIVSELENNELIHKDFWPYDYDKNDTGVTAINLTRYNAKIIAISKEQSVRGARHGQHRPDLIIADDIEDSRSTRTKEARDATFHWYTSEILPLGSENTKYVTVGNLLHEDSLIMRLRNGIESGKRSGIFQFYPIEDADETPLWSERFPNHEAIKKLEKKIADPIRFEKEYRLRIIPDEDQIICRDDIHYYDPEGPFLDNHKCYCRAVGVDLAISQKDSADYTAMIHIYVAIDENGKIVRYYVTGKPNLVNERLDFTQTLDKIKFFNDKFRPTFYVETTGYQEALVQALKDDNVIDIEPYKPNQDKRARLNMIANYIKTGKIVFNIKGCEDLITQLVGFGVEKHDDLVDALTCAIIMADQVDHTPAKHSVVFGHAPSWFRGGSGGGFGGGSGASMERGSDGSWNFR